MTVNQIRVRLGSLVKRLFTEEFSKRYRMIASQAPASSLPSMHAQYSDDADSFIELAALHIKSRRMLNNLVRASNPLVLTIVYARYMGITEYLQSADQSAERSVSAKDRYFFTELFIDLWRDIYIDSIGKPVR
jgi:hypothetical protein